MEQRLIWTNCEKLALISVLTRCSDARERGATCYSRTQEKSRFNRSRWWSPTPSAPAIVFKPPCLLGSKRVDARRRRIGRLSTREIEDLGRFAASAAAATCRHRGPEFPYRKALRGFHSQ